MKSNTSITFSVEDLLDKIDNLEAHISALEHDMMEYMETAPKPDGQWTEERLRTLEYAVKNLEDNCAPLVCNQIRQMCIDEAHKYREKVKFLELQNDIMGAAMAKVETMENEFRDFKSINSMMEEKFDANISNIYSILNNRA